MLETLDNYAFLQALKYRYESTESGDNLRYLHEGKPNKTVLDDSSCNQYVNAQAFTDHFKMVEVTAPSTYLAASVHSDRMYSHALLPVD